MQVPTLRKSIGRVGAGSLAVALLTFLCYRLHVDFAFTIPLYLLLVVMQSLTGDFYSSVIIAALSVACMDVFFTAPLFSLRMENPLNGPALVAFAITALVITTLVTRVRKEAKSSRLQKERLDRLYELSQQLLALEPEAASGEKFIEPFHRLFGVTAISVFDADTTELHTVGDSQCDLADKTREAYIRGADLDDPASRIAVRCLRARGKMTGAIGFEGLRHPAETGGSLAALAASLVERTNAFRKASEARAAAQAEVYRSAMLDALAHEFKTPLATILAAAGGIREAGPLRPAQEEMADTVENEAARLGNLTSQLLRTARLDREEIRPRMEMIDLTELITKIARQYSIRSPDRRIVLMKLGGEVDVMADRELLRLTLNQLIENACKYSLAGSTVTIEVDRQDELTAVKVSNSGSTIPAAERRLIFERFYRGAEAKLYTAGSGLGLYVARKIALAHGGALDLETSERGNDGVTFCLKIPVTKDELKDAVTTK